MAVQERNGSDRILFRHEGKQSGFSVGRVAEAEAKAKSAQVDYLLMRLRQGLITVPAGVDIVDFVRHDGNPPPPPPEVSPASTQPPETTLGDLRDRYLETHGNGSLEAHTLKGIRRHFGHLTRILGAGCKICGLKMADFQGYVDKRAKAKGRRGLLLPTTIKKELVTLRTAWKWGERMGLVEGRCPVDGLRYAKGDEKPPFQSRAEIERQLPGLTKEKAAELWEVLYLTFDEVGRMLEHIKATAGHPWIYPLVATAAHTGARRGELLRMRIADLDLTAGIVSIRERKRVHGSRTTRRVPLSSALAAILTEWLKVHPGGSFLFAQAATVAGSRTRSAKTGYRSKDRPTTEVGRRAVVRVRERPDVVALTEDEARHHFKHTLAGSEWEVVRGYHVLRHSFVSACASKGVDLRMLQERCGHMSPEMQRRYMHLYPSVQSEAMKSVFGQVGQGIGKEHGTMTDDQRLVMLAQKSREVTIAVGNLHRYEREVEKNEREFNPETYAAIKSEVNDALSALRVIKAAIEDKRMEDLTDDDIQLIRRQAQEEAMTAVAAAKGWTWNAHPPRWRTAQGTFFSSIGEPIAE